MWKDVAAEWVKSALELIFPPRCETCNTLGSDLMCPDCRAEIIIPKAPFCELCGVLLPPDTLAAPTCARCRTWLREGPSPPFAVARYAGLHTGVLRQAIVLFKFENRRRLAAPLAELLADVLQSPENAATLPFAPHEAMLVPIPLHSGRRLWRGFDQAELLCRELALLCTLPMDSTALVRIRNTTPQIGLAPSERMRNIRGAFTAREEAVRGRNILLVDDVYTTGATAWEAARALKRAGADRICVLTVSRPAPQWHPAAMSFEPASQQERA